MKKIILVALMSFCLAVPIKVKVDSTIVTVDYKNINGISTISKGPYTLSFDKEDFLMSVESETDLAISGILNNDGFETKINLYGKQESNYYTIYFWNSDEEVFKDLYSILKKDLK